MNRDEIVDRAIEVVEASGWEALSLRALARDIGVTAPALYEYINSKDDLLRSVAQAGYAALGERWESIGGTPIERLRETGRSYVAFAVERPELFKLMFQYAPAAITGGVDYEHPAATRLFEEGLDDIRKAIADGDLADADPVELGVSLWAAAHGVATVLLMAPDLQDDLWLADRVLDAVLAGLRPGSAG